MVLSLNGNGVERRHFSLERKFEIVKEVLVSKVPVTEVCRLYLQIYT